MVHIYWFTFNFHNKSVQLNGVNPLSLAFLHSCLQNATFFINFRLVDQIYFLLAYQISILEWMNIWTNNFKVTQKEQEDFIIHESLHIYIIFFIFKSNWMLRLNSDYWLRLGYRLKSSSCYWKCYAELLILNSMYSTWAYFIILAYEACSVVRIKIASHCKLVA